MGRTIVSFTTNEYSDECTLPGYTDDSGRTVLAQCCCDCIHQAEVMRSCDMFRDFEKEHTCICNSSLGFYVCTVKNTNVEDMGYGKVEVIPKHYIGCELYTSKRSRNE